MKIVDLRAQNASVTATKVEMANVERVDAVT